MAKPKLFTGTVSAHSKQEQEAAVQLMAEHGSHEASRRTGIAAGTIRRWRHEQGKTSLPNEARRDPDEWAAKKERASQEAFKTAMAALRKVKPLLDAGKAADAQKAAITAAVLIDKSHVLELGAAEARTRVIEALAEPDAPTPDLPADQDRLSEVASILRDIGALDSLDDPDRTPEDWRDGWSDDDWSDDGQRQLPAPVIDPESTPEPGSDPGWRPRTAVRVFGERRQPPEQPEPEPEVITDAEVVLPGDPEREAAVQWDDSRWRQA